LATLVSVRTRRARDGITQTYLLMLFIFIGPFLAQTLLLEPLRSAYEGPVLEWSTYALEWLMAINPMYILGRAVLGSNGNFFSGRGDREVMELILGQSVGAGLALALATWSVRRVHLRAAGVGTVKENAKWQIWSWRPKVGPRAMLWMEMFIERVSGRRGTIARIGVLLLVIVALGMTIFNVLAGLESKYNQDAFEEQWASFNVVLGTIISCSMLLIVAVRASTSIANERDRDTWISLICSPLSAADILWSKLAGSLFAVRWVVVLQLVNWLATLVLVPQFGLSIPFLAGTLTIIAFAIAALGLFFSLWCQNSTRALMATLAVVFTVGGGYYLCCGCVLLPLSMSINNRLGELVMIGLLAPLIPFLLGYPGVVGIVGADATSDATVPLAYLAGNGFYLLVGAGLLAYSFHQFEKLAGRVSLNSANAASQGAGHDPVSRLLRGANPPSA